MNIISKMQNIMLSQNYYIEPYNFYMTMNCNEIATRKVNFELLHAFSFSCTWNKETREIKKFFLHNDTEVENNSLNGHSNQPWING